MAQHTTRHEILVLGGNFGGVGAVHNLLRNTIPSLKQIDGHKSYHITLVTPNTHFYFKIASPRALVQPSLLPEEKLWGSLSEAFAQYPTESLTLVQGVATGLDQAKRTVTVGPAKPEDPAPNESELRYDSLIISTGTTSSSPLWTLHNDQSLTREAFEEARPLIQSSKTVLIAGGGPVGIETAGEIASVNPSAEITLLSGTTKLLARSGETISARAQHYLEKKAGVKVIHNVKTVSVQTTGAVTTVELSDGTSRSVDFFLDATGGRPNTDFLPTGWLDDTKRVLTRDAYFRVKGSDNDDVAGIYVLGDVVAGSANTAIEVDAMVPTVCSSLGTDIAAELKKASESKEEPGLMQGLWNMFFGPKSISQVEFKPMRNTLLVPIGISGGVGQIFGWQAPSFLIKVAKCKSFLIELFEPNLSGSKWK